MNNCKCWCGSQLGGEARWELKPKEINLHYYQFNIGDYHSHTSRLSLLEDLAYRRLLDLYYLNERPFTGTVAEIAREIGMNDCLTDVEYVLNRYFPSDGENRVNKRANEEIESYQAKRKSASKAGKASAKARRGKASEQAFNKRSTDVQPTNNHKPLTTNQEPDKEEHPTGACDLPGKPPPIPVQKIVDLYHESLPELPRIEKLTPGRKSTIQQRWREDLKSLDDWGKFFGAVRTSDFLMGRTDNPFRPNLEWLTKPANFAKIIEGKYHGQNQRTAGQPEQRKTPTERMRSAREAARAKQDGSGGQSYPGPSSDLGHVAGHQELLPRGNS